MNAVNCREKKNRHNFCWVNASISKIFSSEKMVVTVQRVFILSSTVPHMGDRVENHFLPKQIYFKLEV